MLDNFQTASKHSRASLDSGVLLTAYHQPFAQPAQASPLGWRVDQSDWADTYAWTVVFEHRLVAVLACLTIKTLPLDDIIKN